MANRPAAETDANAKPHHVVSLGARAAHRGCRAVALRCRDFDAGGAVCRVRSRLYRARLLRRGNGFVEARAIRYVCGACSLAALAFWAATGDPVTAIVLSILADAAAALPTVRKAWLAPATEDRSAYLIAFAGMVLGILSVEAATFSAYAFNAYLVVISGALVLILYVPRRRSLTETP